MLHSLFSDTVIFSRNFHLWLAIADSEDKQLNISRHAATISWDLVSKIFLSALLITKSNSAFYPFVVDKWAAEYNSFNRRDVHDCVIMQR